MRDKALWQRIEAFEIDTGDGNGDFAARLADVFGWSKRESRRKLAEYRRFLYLAHLYPDDVAPAPDVLNIWQTHLLYTRSYWDDLCRDILGTQLHHDPDAETRDAKDWRRRLRETRALYREEFGRRPPEKVWPRMRTATTQGGIALLGLGALAAGTGLLLPMIEATLAGGAAIVAGLGLFVLGARRPKRKTAPPAREYPKMDMGEEPARLRPEPVPLAPSSRPAEPLTLQPPVSRPVSEPLHLKRPVTRPTTIPLDPPPAPPRAGPDAKPVVSRPITRPTTRPEPPVHRGPRGGDSGGEGSDG